MTNGLINVYVESFPRRIGLSYSGGWRLLLSMKNNFGKCCESQCGYLLLVNGVSWMIYSREHGIKLRLL